MMRRNRKTQNGQATRARRKIRKNAKRIRLDQAFRRLPVFNEDPYLGMQAFNLEVVDAILEQWEAQLLAEYFEQERTPFPTTAYVDALSQLWVFGVYELLRTWRQRAQEVCNFADSLQGCSPEIRLARMEKKRKSILSCSADESGEVLHWRPFERAAEDSDFVHGLQRALDETEWLFRRIESLRVALAKHEMPKTKGSFAMAPGYSRIDMNDGSMWWMTALRGKEVDAITRREIANACRELGNPKNVLILPKQLQVKIAKYPDFSYGVKQVTLVLDDGTEITKAFVGWKKEILSLGDYKGKLIDAQRIVDVRYDEGSKNRVKSPSRSPRAKT